MDWKTLQYTKINTSNVYSLPLLALDVAFGSLYRDQVHLEEYQVCPLLAAATMLQLVCTFTCCTYCTCTLRRYLYSEQLCTKTAT